jgi:hypothetical protein
MHPDRRFRQPRRRRTPRPLLFAIALAVAAAITSLVVYGLTTGAPPPDQASLPPGAALQASDLGARWQLTAVAPATSPPEWPWAQDGICPTYAAGDYPAQLHRQSAADQTYVDATGDTVRQVIERFEPGWAQRSMVDVRHVLAACGRYQGPGGPVSFQIVAAGVAGPDSLLVRGVISHGTGSPSSMYLVVVRGGSLVTTVELPALLGDGFVRRVATEAATRLAGAG